VNVNATKHIPQKCQKYHICRYENQMCSLKLYMHQNPFSAEARPYRAGGAYDATPEPLISRGSGHPSLYPSPWRFRRLDLGASFLRAPPNKIPGYAYDAWAGDWWNWTCEHCHLHYCKAVEVLVSAAGGAGQAGLRAGRGQSDTWWMNAGVLSHYGTASADRLWRHPASRDTAHQ